MSDTNKDTDESKDGATGGAPPAADDKSDDNKTDEMFTNTDESKDGATGGAPPAADDKSDDNKTDEMFTTEWMKTYFAKAMGIYFGPEPVKLLDELSLEGMARYIKSDRCQKVVTMVGAGISTSAGLPDFRTPDSGMYSKLEKYNLSRPEDAFNIDFFKDNPEPYYDIRREMFAALVKPTPCHYFIKLLEEKGKLLRHFTQNIDGLERDAGISDDKMVEAHGTYRTSHCMKCNKQFGKDYCLDKILDKTSGSHVPYCDEADCNGVIKPDVVFFGQQLPKRFAERVKDLEECDFLLILGTSLIVQPFNTITNRTRDNVPRLYINMENNIKGKRHPITVLFFGGGFDFDQEDNIRDVYWQGTCDAGCYALADLLGWGDDLRDLVQREHARIDEEWRLAGKTPTVPTKPKVAPVPAKPKTANGFKPPPKTRPNKSGNTSQSELFSISEKESEGEPAKGKSVKGGEIKAKTSAMRRPSANLKGQSTPARGNRNLPTKKK